MEISNHASPYKDQKEKMKKPVEITIMTSSKRFFQVNGVGVGGELGWVGLVGLVGLVELSWLGWLGFVG